MNVKDTVMRSLLIYPILFKTKLAVYNQFFCVIGNGYDWKKGQLVEDGGKKISKQVPPTIEEAIMLKLGEELEEDWRREIDFQTRIHPGELDKSFPTFLSQLREDIQDIFQTEKRFNDMSFPPQKFKLGKEEWHFYPLSEYSAMCCIPDDVKRDWLEAIEETVQVMKQNPDRVEDPNSWLPKVEDRILEIKSRNKWL